MASMQLIRSVRCGFTKVRERRFSSCHTCSNPGSLLDLYGRMLFFLYTSVTSPICAFVPAVSNSTLVHNSAQYHASTAKLGLSAAPSYPQVWPSVLFWLRLRPYRGLGWVLHRGVKSAPFYIKNGMSWMKMLLHKVPFIWILRSTLSINLSRSGDDPFDR